MYNTSLFVVDFMDKNVYSFTLCTYFSAYRAFRILQISRYENPLKYLLYVYLSTQEVHTEESEGEGVGCFGWKGG